MKNPTDPNPNSQRWTPLNFQVLQNPLKLRTHKIEEKYESLPFKDKNSISSYIQLQLSASNYSSWLSLSSLQQRRVFDRWVTWYCFTKLLGDALTAPFHGRLYHFLSGSAHWNKSQYPFVLVTLQVHSVIFRPSILCLFSHFVPFSQVMSMFCLKLQITLNLGIYISY